MIQTLWCQELHSNFNVYIAYGHQMVQIHVRSPRSICLTLTPRLQPGIEKNQCRVPVARAWRLASRWRLLHTACQPRTSYGAQRYGNHYTPYSQPGLWLVTVRTTGTLCTTLPTVAISPYPMISLSLDHLTSTWLTIDLQQTPTWSKLSPPPPG